MKTSVSCLECTFIGILIFVLTTIFIGILIEENLYHYEKDFEYGPYNDEPTYEPAKTHIPVLTNLTKVKLPNHNQEDPELVKDLASKFIPPCAHLKEYHPLEYVREGIGSFEHIRKLNSEEVDRFFFEIGASDGEMSNTLFLEKSFYWKGLLVEADPAHFQNLIKMHRKAWIAPVCMSLNTSAYVAHFRSSANFDGKLLLLNDSRGDDTVEVICYPFYSFVLALDVKRIDYLSISVVGHEMEILETIPFDKVYIAFISVDVTMARGGREGVTKFLLRHGFDELRHFTSDEMIFVNIDEDYW